MVSQPADNLVSKLSANPNATIASVTSEMGVVGLFTRGLGLRIVMVGTLTGLQWGIYDAYKAYAGVAPSSLGSAPVCDAPRTVSAPPLRAMIAEKSQ